MYFLYENAVCLTLIQIRNSSEISPETFLCLLSLSFFHLLLYLLFIFHFPNHFTDLFIHFSIIHSVSNSFLSLFTWISDKNLLDCLLFHIKVHSNHLGSIWNRPWHKTFVCNQITPETHQKVLKGSWFEPLSQNLIRWPNIIC